MFWNGSDDKETVQNSDPLWETVRDEERGVTFKYPREISAKYVSAHEWPPVIEARIAQFLCSEALREVDGRKYCVGSETGAAAGSAYTKYVYSTMKNDLMFSATFTLRYPNCGNYEETLMRECEAEREAFDLDSLVDRIIQSAQIIN